MWFWMAAAFAGYGDPVDGHPSARERELFVWADAARVAPSEFIDAYTDGGCAWADFAPSEQTPHPPLRWSPDLAAAAHAHTQDMQANDWFGHASSDGVPLVDRLSPIYPGLFGENLAYGFDNGYRATFRGWMCSEGHRAVLMDDRWTELGTGVIDAFYTADFGAGYEGPRPIGMGAHLIRRNGNVAFIADWWASDGEAPDRYVVVVDGVAWRMGRRWGEAGQGIYGAAVPLDEGCHRYHFEAERGGVVTRFPEQGAYGWGDCGWDEPAAEWSASRVEATASAQDQPGVPTDPAIPLSGAAADELDSAIGIGPPTSSCTPGTLSPGWVALIGMVAALRRRPVSPDGAPRAGP